MTKIKQDIKMYQRIALLMIADIAFVFLASFISILVRLDFANIDWDLLNSYMSYYWLDVLIVITIFWLFNMYKSMWRFASLVELRRLITAVFATAFIKLFVFELFFDLYIPRSWYLLDPLFLLALCASTRFMYRNLRSLRNQSLNSRKIADEDVTNVMIVGAGEAGTYYYVKLD